MKEQLSMKAVCRGRGRPRISEEEKKRSRCCKFTDAEWRRIVSLASDMGLSASRMIILMMEHWQGEKPACGSVSITN